MACSIEPHRGAQLGKVAHAECFAGASPCAPNSRAARGVRYHTTRGTTAGPNHYDACEGRPPASTPAHHPWGLPTARGGAPPRAARTDLPTSGCRGSPPPVAARHPATRSNRGAFTWDKSLMLLKKPIDGFQIADNYVQAESEIMKFPDF